MTVVTFIGTSGSFTIPAGVTSIDVVCIGAGGNANGVNGGGESSFKSSGGGTTYCRATGGAAGGGAAGTGTHGDSGGLFTGGTGGANSTHSGGGGGGAGPNGNGGNGGAGTDPDVGGTGGAGGSAGSYGVGGGGGGVGYPTTKGGFSTGVGGDYGGGAGGNNGQNGGSGGGAARKIGMAVTPGTTFDCVGGAKFASSGVGEGGQGICQITYTSSVAASGSTSTTGGGTVTEVGKKGGVYTTRNPNPIWSEHFSGTSLPGDWATIGGTIVVADGEARIQGAGISRALTTKNASGVEVYVLLSGIRDVTGNTSGTIEVNASGLSQKFSITLKSDGHVYANVYNAAGTRVVNDVDLGASAIGWYRLRVIDHGRRFEVAHAQALDPRKVARYIRLELFTTWSGTGFDLARFAELEVSTNYGGQDLTNGKTATSGTAFSGFPASAGIDNNTSSEWAAASGTPNDWYTVDLGSIQEPRCLRFYRTQPDSSFPTNVVVYGATIASPASKSLSVDQADWTRLGSLALAVPSVGSWTPWTFWG